MRRSDAWGMSLTGLLILSLVIFLGCGSKTPEQPASTSPGPAASSEPASGAGTGTAAKPAARPAAKPAAAAVTVPAGHTMVVRLNEAVGSKISKPGDTFSAVVAEPVDVDGKVVIPKGAEATGTVVDAAPLGRFKGGARLRITLNSISTGSGTYKLETAAVSHAIKGKGKRTAVMVGGGAGLGALIGGLAGGGKGAAIGAAAGAGAGTAGSAFTGNKDIVLPAESLVTFKLVQPLEVR